MESLHTLKYMDEAYYPGEEPAQYDRWFNTEGQLTQEGQEYYDSMTALHPDWFPSVDEYRLKFIKWLRENKGAFDEWGIPDPDPEMKLFKARGSSHHKHSVPNQETAGI